MGLSVSTDLKTQISQHDQEMSCTVDREFVTAKDLIGKSRDSDNEVESGLE